MALPKIESSMLGLSESIKKGRYVTNIIWKYLCKMICVDTCSYKTIRKKITGGSMLYFLYKK